ncbi:MAG: lytic transglycosylase domain-containing protein [Deltaproteobacteria bacterium]|nr:lytic transglycosylase domain-containing protein [Deltaproteobacteria bacterium]
MGTWRTVLSVTLAAMLAASCAVNAGQGRYNRGRAPVVKDKNPALWNVDNARVAKFKAYYMKTNTVEKALANSRPHIRRILPEFRRRGLPEQLAYLPMLESLFTRRADSGHARGLWQFTPTTARAMGLRVSRYGDDRLNIPRATKAAANYLDQLGDQFDYDWALALAAYNGGPGYVERSAKSQNTQDFWALDLREETADYIPRFVAMLQVAKEKYPHLVEGRW